MRAFKYLDIHLRSLQPCSQRASQCYLGRAPEPESVDFVPAQPSPVHSRPNRTAPQPPRLPQIFEPGAKSKAALLPSLLVPPGRLPPPAVLVPGVGPAVTRWSGRPRGVDGWRDFTAPAAGARRPQAFVPCHCCTGAAPGAGHASDSHRRVPRLPGRGARGGPPPPPRTESSPPGLAGSRGRAGRGAPNAATPPAGLRVAQK